jgi:hypothetical protein
MKKKFGKRMIVGVAFVALAAVVGPGFNAQGNGERTLVGAWDMQITFTNCETGEVLRERAGLISFIFGGVLQEFGTGQAIPQNRTDAHGNWSHVSGKQYYAVAKAFRFNPDGSLAGSAKLRRTIELATDGSAFNATVTSDILDTNGNVIANGCATETGTRIE